MRVVDIEKLCVCRYCGLHFSQQIDGDTEDNCNECPEGCEAFLKAEEEDAAFEAAVWAEYDAEVLAKG